MGKEGSYQRSANSKEGEEKKKGRKREKGRRVSFRRKDTPTGIA